MEQILITVYVLGLERDFDIFLPVGLSMKDCLDLIQNTIKSLTADNYEVNPNAKLYSNKGLINLKNIVKYSGLKNGCKVLLI